MKELEACGTFVCGHSGGFSHHEGTKKREVLTRIEHPELEFIRGRLTYFLLMEMGRKSEKTEDTIQETGERRGTRGEGGETRDDGRGTSREDPASRIERRLEVVFFDLAVEGSLADA